MTEQTDDQRHIGWATLTTRGGDEIRLEVEHSDYDPVARLDVSAWVDVRVLEDDPAQGSAWFADHLRQVADMLTGSVAYELEPETR